MTERFIELPDTTLHYGVAGDGPPLVIVPATISEIRDWASLLQFMAQRYTAHFFELPGHGESSPFSFPFSSEAVAHTVSDFMDALGFERVSLMGFSFGGILALRTLKLLGDRVDRVVLLSPCVSREGLLRPPAKMAALKAAASSLRWDPLRTAVLAGMHDERTAAAVAWFMQSVGGYETAFDLRERLLTLKPSTLEVLVAQVREVLTVTEADLAGPFSQACFFGMSVRDPLLDFATSLRFAESNFSDLVVERFDFPYHTPPEPLTFDGLNADYAGLLDAFDR